MGTLSLVSIQVLHQRRLNTFSSLLDWDAITPIISSGYLSTTKFRKIVDEIHYVKWKGPGTNTYALYRLIRGLLLKWLMLVVEEVLP